MSIATELYRVSRQELKTRGGSRLDEVRVAIGELSAVEPELLQFAWEAITSGGCDAGSVLSIDWCPARQRCLECGEIDERQVGSWLRLCPICKEPLQIEGGDELDLVSIRFEARAADREATAMSKATAMSELVRP